MSAVKLSTNRQVSALLRVAGGPKHAQSPVSVRLRIRKRQRGAPGPAKQHPVLDAQVIAQQLKVRYERLPVQHIN